MTHNRLSTLAAWTPTSDRNGDNRIEAPFPSPRNEYVTQTQCGTTQCWAWKCNNYSNTV